MTTGILDLTNEGTRWRVFELEQLEDVFETVHGCSIGYEHPEEIINAQFPYIFWRPNTEETGKDNLNWMLDLEAKMPHAKSINSPKGFLSCHAKETAFNRWEEYNIPTPQWFTFSDIDLLKEYFTLFNFTYPVLLRLNNLVRGEASYRITEPRDLLSTAAKLLYMKEKSNIKSTKVMCVQFIDTRIKNCFVSYRIIVAGNKIITGYGRLSKNDWVAITGKFDSSLKDAFFYFQHRCKEICNKYNDLILKAVHCLNLNLQGVDLIEDTRGNIYFLEVQPGFQTGYQESPKPFYNPTNKELISLLINNKAYIEKELPFYNVWLDKNLLFELIFKELKRYLDEPR